jgi:hypothetical protein
MNHSAFTYWFGEIKRNNKNELALYYWDAWLMGSDQRSVGLWWWESQWQCVTMPMMGTVKGYKPLRFRRCSVSMFRTSSLVAPAQFRRRGLIVWHGLQWMAVLLWRPSKNYPKKCSWEHLATKMYRKICPKRGFNQQHQLRNFRASKPFFTMPRRWNGRAPSVWVNLAAVTPALSCPPTSSRQPRQA